MLFDPRLMLGRCDEISILDSTRIGVRHSSIGLKFSARVGPPDEWYVILPEVFPR
jgi:hypothetical protein